MRIEQGSPTDGTAGYTPYWRKPKLTAHATDKVPEFAAELLPSTPRPFMMDTKQSHDDDHMLYISTTTDGTTQYFAKIREKFQ